MNKFGIQIETTKHNPLYIFPLAKRYCFESIFQLPFMSRTYITYRFCIFAYLINVMFMDIFYYNTPIYRKILLQYLQFKEKY